MTEKNQFQIQGLVEWQWLGRTIRGKILEIFYETIVLEIKGKKIKRKGSPENPAYLVESEAGNRALKLRSELKEAKTQAGKSASRPRMFQS